MTIEELHASECTGCKLCGDICPKSAIYFENDNTGFWFPKINHELCINCNLCYKKCPSLNVINSGYKSVPLVYAVWSLDDNVRCESTSGGVYYELAKGFIENGGYIVGSVFSDDYKSARHIVGHSIQDLKRIMGSKYFQSDTEGIYKSIKKLLDARKKVMFTGTPCQIAAIASIFGTDNPNLFLCDFICKGINSPKAYKAYVEEIESKIGSKIVAVKQKSKKTGWESLATNIKFENGKEYHKDRYTDWWIRGYTCGNLFMRENCQMCRYKGIPRLADITMGDFWKIENCSDDDLYKGISVCFVNSDKGDILLKSIKGKTHIEERTLDEVVKGNPYLFGQALQKGDRNRFFEMLDNTSFSSAVKATYTETSKQKIKRIIKILLKKLGRKKW